MALQPAAYAAHIEREGSAFNRAARGALHLTVPTCPDWTGYDLAAHVGSLYRWYATLLTEYSPSRPARDETPPPAAQVEDWLDDGLGRLLAVLTAADPDLTMWTLAGTGRASFWWRRAANELAVHRWDMEGAAGEPADIAGDLALDGIAELVEFFLTARRAPAPPSGDAVMALEPSAPKAAGWRVRFHDDDVTVAGSDGSANLRLRDSASRILVALWGRVPVAELDWAGDLAVFDLWRGAIRF